MFRIKEFLYRYGLMDMEQERPASSNCTICFDIANDEDEVLIVHRLPCGHMFHKNCILRWLRCNNVCPNCRQDVNKTPVVVAPQTEIVRSNESIPVGAAVLLWPRGRPPLTTYLQRIAPAPHESQAI